MENIKKFLESMGFGKNETEVYTILVEIGTASVLKISKHTTIHRSNIYDALRTLVQKGLVYEIDQATRLFSARPPNSLLYYLKLKETELQEAIKNYEKNRTIKKEDSSKARITQGHFALREAIHALLEMGKPINVYGIPDRAAEEIGPMLKEFHAERIKKGILMRHIYNSNAVKRIEYLNKMKHTEARVLSKKYDSDATTIISGNKVIIVLWEDNINIIEINDEKLASPYENYFDILWKRAKVSS